MCARDVYGQGLYTHVSRGLRPCGSGLSEDVGAGWSGLGRASGSVGRPTGALTTTSELTRVSATAGRGRSRRPPSCFQSQSKGLWARVDTSGDEFDGGGQGESLGPCASTEVGERTARVPRATSVTVGEDGVIEKTRTVVGPGHL